MRESINRVFLFSVGRNARDGIFRGPLQKPGVKVNLGELLVHGAVAWAIEGLTLLGEALVTRLTVISNPCEVVMKAGQ